VLEREKRGDLALDVEVDAYSVFERFPSTEKIFRNSEKKTVAALIRLPKRRYSFFEPVCPFLRA
jgi:hypothetical protein